MKLKKTTEIALNGTTKYDYPFYTNYIIALINEVKNDLSLR